MRKRKIKRKGFEGRMNKNLKIVIFILLFIIVFLLGMLLGMQIQGKWDKAETIGKGDVSLF